MTHLLPLILMIIALILFILNCLDIPKCQALGWCFMAGAFVASWWR